MVTKYIKITPPVFTGLDEAADALKNGRLVAFPTETVYGLGANALDENAVREIFTAKGRPSDNPLIVHIADISTLKLLVMKIKPEAEKLMHAFWPGPLTLVFEKSPNVPKVTTGGLDTVAVRMPDHPVALELIKKAGVPVAAPSANRSGKPSPTLAEHVLEDMDGRIPYIIDAGPCRVGVESTVLDLTEDTPVILRPGGVTIDMIEDVIGRVKQYKTEANIEMIKSPKSPGMKYVHYAPKGEVIVVSGKNKVSEWINEKLSEDEKNSIKAVVVAADENIENYSAGIKMSYGSIKSPQEAAASIFRIFRDCDRLGAEKIYIEAIPEYGIGYAVMNRIKKAAGGKVVNLE
ncbi:MAG: threonylcarbamoyl-AMP synthase [Clostridiaceae bacterium]|nr:threonylcarbamoyl-AMP synthase [Clostridiaceae bacterium]